MALHLGSGLIETRGPLKLPKLERAVLDVLGELGFEQLPDAEPTEELVEETAIPCEILANPEGVLAIQTTEVRVVRDLARMVSERVNVPFVVFTTEGSLFGRRSVEVVCRKFEVNESAIEELPVMATHTAEVTDVEHNELRQAAAALRQRIDGANESMLQAEGTAGLKVKKVFRFKRIEKKIKWSSPRLARLMEQIERCESFEVVKDGAQPIVKLTMAGAKSMSYLKPDELTELEAALVDRPEIEYRRADA